MKEKVKTEKKTEVGVSIAKELTFFEKLVNIQATLKVSKNQFNAFGKYKYRSCEDILEAVKPLLVKHSLSLLLSDKIETAGERYYVKAIVRISNGVDTIETTAYAREPFSKKGMDEAQITGATSSYARKYALNGLLCIDDTKDIDYNQKGKEKERSGVRTPEALPDSKNSEGFRGVDSTKPLEATPKTHIAEEGLKTAPMNKSFNERFKEARLTLGDEDYYHILSKQGFKSISDITSKEKAEKILKSMEWINQKKETLNNE